MLSAFHHHGVGTIVYKALDIHSWADFDPVYYII